MTTIVTRSQWGARAAIPGGNRFGSILGSAIHWEAAPPPAGHSLCAGAVRKVQDFHMDVRGWNDIAYNWIACNHDYLFQGRIGGTAANGTDYGNLHFIARCWLGGPGYSPTPEALNALAHQLVHPVYPHSHFYPTACPGDDLRTWIAAGANPPPPTPIVGHWIWQEGTAPVTGPKTRVEVEDRLNTIGADPTDRTITLTHKAHPGGPVA